MDDVPDEVTFLPWDCELTSDSLYVMRVQYLEGDLELGRRTGNDEFTFYSAEGQVDLKGQKLVITVFSLEKAAIFDICFFDTHGFRVLDEAGLVELWNEFDARKKAGLSGSRLFRVSGHGWSKESSLSFFTSPFSWIVSTDWDCIEIISPNDPIVEFVKDVIGVAGPVPDDGIDSILNPQTKH